MFLLAIGLILTVWSGAGVLLLTTYDRDLKTEETFCRTALVCDPERIVHHVEESPNVGDRTTLLKRDPHFPFEWEDLGDAYVRAGKTAEAEICFRHGVEMSPRWPPVLIRAVEFYFPAGNSKAALPLASDILDQVKEYDARIFEHYLKRVPLQEALERGFPPGNPRPVRSWLAYMVGLGTWPDIQETWKWATSRGLINVATANAYITWMLTKHTADAPKVWKEYLGPWSEEGYLEKDFLLNGGFENGFTGCLLDWTLQPVPGVEAKLDRGSPAEGKWSMRVQFDGEHNVGFTGLRQDVVLAPGKYRLRAKIRTEGLTTDQGVQLRLSPECQSEKFLGTRTWTAIDVPFTVSQVKLFDLMLMRTPSFRFDNRIKGAVWVDDVRIEPSR